MNKSYATNFYKMMSDDIPTVSMTNKCIVLDLDATLIATQDSMDSLKKLDILSKPSLMELRNRIYRFPLEDLEAPGYGSKYNFWGIKRPHLEEFLIFCFSYFKVVAVWSAGKKKYVEAIVDDIFRDIRPPHIVFTYDDIDRDKKDKVVKPLEKMIKFNDITKKYMNLSNIYALDDTKSTFSLNKGNGVLIPPFEPKPNINSLSRDDPTLLQFKYWLLQPEIMKVDDVRNIDKSKIFDQSLKYYKSRLGAEKNKNKFLKI